MFPLFSLPTFHFWQASPFPIDTHTHPRTHTHRHRHTHTQTHTHTHTHTKLVSMLTFSSSLHLCTNQRTDALCQSTNSPTFRPIRAEGWFNGKSAKGDRTREGIDWYHNLYSHKMFFSLTLATWNVLRLLLTGWTQTHMLVYKVMNKPRTNDDFNRGMEKVEESCSSLKKESRDVVLEKLHLILKIQWLRGHSEWWERGARAKKCSRGKDVRQTKTDDLMKN